MTRDDLRTPHKTRKHYIELNPAWSKYYELQDRIIDEEIRPREALNVYFDVLYQLLSQSSTREEKQEVVVAFENLRDIRLLFLPGFVEHYEDTLEWELLFDVDPILFDSPKSTQTLNELEKRIRNYVQTT